VPAYYLVYQIGYGAPVFQRHPIDLLANIVLQPDELYVHRNPEKQAQPIAMAQSPSFSLLCQHEGRKGIQRSRRKNTAANSGYGTIE
jgi:hypothetical protein